MYGTVMIATIKPGTADQVLEVAHAWLREQAPKIAGFIEEWDMIADDGVTVVSSVKFASKEAYLALADDPEQDRWWREDFRPLLTDEPRWIDGSWDSVAG